MLDGMAGGSGARYDRDGIDTGGFVRSLGCAIANVETYHWNYGMGSRPGTIGFQSQFGSIYGPFAATGMSGQGNAPNVDWIATPNITPEAK